MLGEEIAALGLVVFLAGVLVFPEPAAGEHPGVVHGLVGAGVKAARVASVIAMPEISTVLVASAVTSNE